MYTCECLPGYSGTNCQNWINTCNPNPCQNGANCIQNWPNKYHCICLDGYTGTNCELLVNPCVNQKCSKNFTNINLNIYTEPQLFNFDSFKQCIIDSWKSVNPNSILLFFICSEKYSNTKNSL